MDFDKLLQDPAMLAAVGGGLVVLVVLIVLLTRRSKGPKGVVVDDSKARARMRLRQELQVFRDELQRAANLAGPIFRLVETETNHAAVIGHWRKAKGHRIQVRSPDLQGLRGIARSLSYDGQPISDLDAAWRKLGKTIADYNDGTLDDHRAPIATVKELEKDLQKGVLLAKMALQQVSG